MSVTATLRIAINFPGHDSTRDHTQGEYRDITGSGPTWEAAKQDALTRVPDGALKLHWIRGG